MFDIVDVKGKLLIEPFEKDLYGNITYLKSQIISNLVVDSGRDYISESLYKTTERHLVSYLAVGESDITPEQHQTFLLNLISLNGGSNFKLYDSYSPPTLTNIGVSALVYVMYGNLFPVAKVVKEVGLFLEDGNQPPSVLLTPYVMFSRAVFNPGLDVHPYDGSTEKGFRLTWYIYF